MVLLTASIKCRITTFSTGAGRPLGNSTLREPPASTTTRVTAKVPPSIVTGHQVSPRARGCALVAGWGRPVAGFGWRPDLLSLEETCFFHARARFVLQDPSRLTVADLTKTESIVVA